MPKSEREIFLTALEMRSSEARLEFLNSACEGDLELRRRVEELLDASSRADRFLEDSPFGMPLTIHADAPQRYQESLAGTSLDFLEPSDKPGCLGRLAGYEIVGLEGRGGFGIVLRAFDPKLNRVVAIKVMAPELASNPMAVRRFLREAQAAAAVSHDHVVTIHAIEEQHCPPFLVMEFVEGQSLKDKVDSEGALEVTEILRIGMQAAMGLQAAHAQGLVHRDIKPANILLENGIRRVKITDFGLARAVDDVGVTQTGMIAGTPEYMSPEQGLGKPLDHRSDLFSLGAVLYTLCTGRSPFRADSAVATLRRVCDDEPRPIGEINSDIPTWLETIVMRLLSKDADQRYGSASNIADILRAALAHRQSPNDPAALPRLLRSVNPTMGTRLRPSTAATIFAVLTTVQLFTLLVAFFVAVVEVESILFTGPTVGMALGVAIAAAAWKAQLGWTSIGYGIMSPTMVAFIAFGIFVMQLSPAAPVPVVIFCGIYVIMAFVWGVRELRHVSKRIPPDQLAPEARRFCFLTALGTQIFSIAASIAAATVEIESVVATGVLVGLMLGVGISLLSFVEARVRATFLFAVSAPLFSLLVFFLVLAMQLSTVSTGGATELAIVRILLLYGFLSVPLGCYCLARELDVVDAKTSWHPQYNLFNTLLAMAVLAFVFTAARPYFSFGVEAYLAGSLFTMTVLALAGILAYQRVRKGKGPYLPWISFGVAAMLLVTASMGLVVWWDAETDQGYVFVKTGEVVDLEVYSHRTGKTVVHRGLSNGDALGNTPSGMIDVRVTGRDDLKVIPSRVKVLRATPLELRVRPVAANAR